jgi:anti-sigma B factor antagonist
MPLQTVIRNEGNALIVDCKGRIIVGDEATFLNHQVRDLVKENPAVVLNLSEVTYIDSTGLGTLVGLYGAAHNAGHQIKLAGLTERIKDLLQITKLVTVFETFDSVGDAVSSFRTAA